MISLLDDPFPNNKQSLLCVLLTVVLIGAANGGYAEQVPERLGQHQLRDSISSGSESLYEY